MPSNAATPTPAISTTHRSIAGLAAVAALCGFAPLATANAEPNALVWTIDDPELEWGPCPEFMPDGCALAVLQGDPAGPNADVFFRLPGNSTAPHHWHTSAERMVLITGELHVDFDDQDVVVMTPGTYAYGPPGLPHTAECRSDEPCVLFIAFEEAVDAVPVE